MMNWFDILLLAIVLFSAVMGWQRGLIRQLFDLASIVAAYIVALRYGSDFILWLDNVVPLTRWLPAWLSS
ncbi:MAG: CvpA family protein, partial [Bacillota bacterium]|nr:CvpA family protein [Bacillota bacterium]